MRPVMVAVMMMAAVGSPLPPAAVMAPVMDLVDYARSLAHIGELADGSARDGSGLSATDGKEAGQRARHDGQRNNSSHHDSFLSSVRGDQRPPPHVSNLSVVIRAQDRAVRMNLR
jgi:hypothetical protein